MQGKNGTCFATRAIMSSDIDSTYLAHGKILSDAVVDILSTLAPEYSREQLFCMLSRWTSESLFAREDVQEALSDTLHDPKSYTDCKVMPEAHAMVEALRELLPVRLFVSIRKQVLREVTMNTLGEVDGAKVVLCPNSIPDNKRKEWKVHAIFRIATVFAKKGRYTLKAHVDDDFGLVKHWGLAWQAGVRLFLLGRHKIRQAGVTVCCAHADVVRAARHLIDESE